MKPLMVSGIIVAALMAYVGHQHVYAPTQRALGILRQQLAEETATQELRVQLARSLDDFESLRKQFPQDSSMESLLHEVTQHALEQGIQLQSIVPQDRKDLRDATQLSVQLQASASYHQLGKFISGLETASPFMWVEDLQFNRPPGSSGETTVVRLIVSTLFVPSANVSSPPKAPPKEIKL